MSGPVRAGSGTAAGLARQRSMTARVPQPPDIGRDGRELLAGELRSAHGGHGAAVFLRLRHAAADGALDAAQAAVAPHPFAGSEIRAERRAFALRAVTAGAGARSHLAVKY